MGFHSLLTGTIEGDIEQNVGSFTYGLGQMSGRLDAFNKSMSDMRAKSTLTQTESNEALRLLSKSLLDNTNINQKTIAPRIAEWQRTSDNHFQNQRDVAAKAAAEAKVKTAADAKAKTATETKAIANFDEIGQEDVNEVYSSIATPQPEPSVAVVANNYNTPSLLGNVQAAEEYVSAPVRNPVSKFFDYFTGSSNKGVIKPPGFIEQYAPIDEQLKADYQGSYRGDPSFGEAKGASMTTFASGLFGPTPEGVPDVFDSALALPQTVLAGFGSGVYQIATDGLTKKAFGDWVEQMQGYIGARYRREDINTAGDAWKSGRKTEAFQAAIPKDKRKKRQTAREAIAKAQAIADSSKEARQTEREKQRMVESNSFSDTDSGSFDEGGNYSDWGSQESYDDDFGEDSQW